MNLDYIHLKALEKKKDLPISNHQLGQKVVNKKIRLLKLVRFFSLMKFFKVQFAKEHIYILKSISEELIY